MSDTTSKDDELYKIIQGLVSDVAMNVVRNEPHWIDKNIARGNETLKLIKQYGTQERIVGGEEALNGIATHAAMGGRKTVDVSWLMSASGQEWVRYWLEDEELTALKDKEED